MQMDPKDTGNYFGLMKLYEDAGRFEEAEQILNQVREAVPNDPNVYVTAAGFYNRRGEFDKAATAFEDRARLDPNNPEAYLMLAAFFEEKARKDYTLSNKAKGDYVQRGLTAVDKALGIKQDFIEALTFKNLLLRQQALVEKNPKVQKELLDEADKLRGKAIELQKLKTKGVGA
jgi:tetratricopeptide (TPR) repeat protein